MSKFYYIILLITLVASGSVFGQTDEQGWHVPSPRAKRSAIRIEGTNLRKYVYSSDFIFFNAGFLPEKYLYQELSNGNYQQYYLDDTSQIAFELNYENNRLGFYKIYWPNGNLLETGGLGKKTSYSSNGKKSYISIREVGKNEEYYLFDADENIVKHGTAVYYPYPRYFATRKFWAVQEYEPNGQLARRYYDIQGFKITRVSFCGVTIHLTKWRF